MAYGLVRAGLAIDNYGALLIVGFLGFSGLYIGAIARPIYRRWFANL